MPDLIDAKGEFFVKDAADAAFYLIDWAAELGSDTISSVATWVVPAGLTSANPSNDTTTSQIKLSGGTPGMEYGVTCSINTTGNQSFKRTLWIRIAPFPELPDNALIDLDYLKTAMRLYESSPETSIDNRLLAQKIAESSDLIETYCNRSFHSADYVERIRWTRTVNLHQYPVHYIKSIHRAMREGFLLTNNAVGKDYATVSITNNRKLYLNVQGGVSHGMETIDLALPANDTLTKLLTVINALTTGWTATLSIGRNGNERSEDLMPFSISPFVDPVGLIMYLVSLPDSCQYELNESAGILKDLSTSTPVYYHLEQSTAWIKYRAGYDEIPDDLKGICAQMCKHLYYESTRDSGLRSETIGDYSYTRESGQDVEGTRASVPGHLIMALSQYESPVVA